MDLKSAARAAFERAEVDVVSLSHRIHAHPELKWEEQRACTWLSEALTGYGFLSIAGSVSCLPLLRPCRVRAPACDDLC